jgi:hypothetical protein
LQPRRNGVPHCLTGLGRLSLRRRLRYVVLWAAMKDGPVPVGYNSTKLMATRQKHHRLDPIGVTVQYMCWRLY